MSRDLPSDILRLLEEHGDMTAREVAYAVGKRAGDVADLLKTDARFSGPFPRADGRLVYRPAPRLLSAETARGRVPGGRRSHCEKILDLLADGRSHSFRELYGLGVMVHSRVADLRKRGYDIRVETVTDQGRRDYLYTLVGAPLSPAVPDPHALRAQTAGREDAHQCVREGTAGLSGVSGEQLTLGAA